MLISGGHFTTFLLASLSLSKKYAMHLYKCNVKVMIYRCGDEFGKLHFVFYGKKMIFIIFTNLDC